jgi:hypothetical protein
MDVPKVRARDIKFALMWYFRFKRNMLCATECMCEDVMVLKGHRIYECEVKISKGDLWKGEARKSKHIHEYLTGSSHYFVPNKFYMCVPTYLKDEAIKWVNQINPKYGIIEYVSYYDVRIVKRALDLTNVEIKNWRIMSVFKRVCAEYISFLQDQLQKEKTNV